jgi:hypothetical protein
MRLLQYQSSTEAYRGVIMAFLTNQEGLTDGKSGLRAWSRDVIIEITQPDVTIDLSQVGFTKRRWSVFLEHYFDAAPFSTFYQRTLHGRPAQETGYSCPVNAPHTMGNCLIGLTAHIKPLRIGLHSRACVWAPTGLLDLSFASLLAQNLQRDLGAPSSRIVWHIDQLQVNAIKSLPILSEFGLMDPIAAGEYDYSPFGRLVRYEFEKLHRTIHSPYKTYRRYAGKMEKLKSGDRPAPFIPTLPDRYRLAAIEKLPGHVTIVDIATELDMPLERVQWSARQMGLAFQESIAATWPITDPKIQRLIAILRHRKGMRGVGG